EWKQGRVTLRLLIHKDHELGVYGAECTLIIDYQPDLTPFFTDAYQQSLQLKSVKSYQTLPQEFKISDDYVQVKHVFYTPTCFEAFFDNKHKSLIWLDAAAGKIGFANRHLCRIFPISKHSGLLLEIYYWRDEPGGYDLYYKNNKKKAWHHIASFGLDEHFSEDEFMNQWTSMTGIPCKRQERREYY